MSTPEFDWTKILPEDERKKVLASREAFFDGFPTKDEIEQAGREGRVAFAVACATVDARKEAERLLNAATDHIAGTLEQPANPRAWEQLLIYCPLALLEAAFVRKARNLTLALVTDWEDVEQRSNVVPWCEACQSNHRPDQCDPDLDEQRVPR